MNEISKAPRGALMSPAEEIIKFYAQHRSDCSGAEIACACGLSQLRHKACYWCPERNRPLRELPISAGWIVQDSNLLACSEKHVRAVFEMLAQQKRAIYFNGGLDKDFLRPWHRDLFDSIDIGELWFACDLPGGLPSLERAAHILEGIPLRKRRCYTMIGHPAGIPGFRDAETVEQAQQRIERVFELGFMPFAQLYRPDDGPKVYFDEWKNLQRKWCRPAAYMPPKDR